MHTCGVYLFKQEQNRLYGVAGSDDPIFYRINNSNSYSDYIWFTNDMVERAVRDRERILTELAFIFFSFFHRTDINKIGSDTFPSHNQHHNCDRDGNQGVTCNEAF